MHLVQIDISNDESVAKAANNLEQHIEHLDNLINNPGFAQDLSVAPSEEMLSARKNQYEVNTFGPVRITQALLPLPITPVSGY